MDIEYRTGDLFTTPDVDALAHGCNCAGAMGRGIAVEFKRRWPAMYREYRERCRDGRLTLGGIFPWKAPDGLTIYNLGTQAHWRVRAELPAVRSSVEAMLKHAVANGIHRIALPKIAAGLGALLWSEVEETIRAVAEPYDIDLVVVSLPA
jgi:O-acetyl-ADP-ribose deacetylase (regulator of RNase III)